MRTHLLCLLACFVVSIGARADELSGRVQNQTKGVPAAGDQVILLLMAEGMQEQAHTLTDNQGAFKLPVANATTQYVIRVWHQGVNYDKVANASTPLEIDVYDAVRKIAGLGGNIGIVQMQSDGKVLTVAEMYAIDNTSKPPVTQASPRNFPITLPLGAELDSVEAKGPGGIWTKAPVKEQGHGQFNVSFPMRPGETLFKFRYHLAYQNSTTFHLRLAYPIKKLAVMHPPSMTFTATRAQTFSHPGNTGGMEVEQAVAEPVRGSVPAFVISGTGLAQAPATANGTQAPGAGASAAKPPRASRPTQSTATMQIWALSGGIAAFIAAAAFLLWRTRRKAPMASTRNASSPLMDALRDELFHLESERLRGSISPEEYTASKQALNVTIERALKTKH